MELEEVLAAAKECGFDHVGPLDPGKLEFLPEVRDMCAADKCHLYNRSWMCPPAIGTLEEMSGKAASYHRGILVQCTTQMEDDFDVEAMEENEQRQKEALDRLLVQLRPVFPGCLPMGSGGCTRCESCTFPEAPCRFPEKAYPSMEACGLFVSKVCKQNGMEYYYGPQTMTYTSCILLD